MLASGVDGVYGDSFLVSIAAPYMKAQMMCSNARFIFKSPHILLGLIPVGVEENGFPIHGIAAVSSSFRFRIGQFLLALLLALVGFLFLSDKSLYGVPIVLGAILALFAAFSRELLVQNHAGAYTAIRVSLLESGRLKAFTRELQNRIFANQAQIHYEEAQAVRTAGHAAAACLSAADGDPAAGARFPAAGDGGASGRSNGWPTSGSGF